MEKPNVYNILDWYEGLKSVYEARNSHFDAMLNLYRGNIDCAQPPDWPRHVPPTHKRLVRWGANQLISDIPVVEVSFGKPTQENKVAADKCRRFCQVQLENWDRMNDMPPLKECGTNKMIYGMSALKGPLYNAKAWPKKNRDFYKKTVPAIIVRSFEPVHLLPDPAGRFVIEASERLVAAVRASWPGWVTGMEDFEKVLWLEFWSDDWRSYIAGDKPVLRTEDSSGIQKNVYSFIPYAWRYTGWGKADPDGDVTEKCAGIYDGLISSLEAQARGRTALDNQLRKDVYGRFFFNPLLKKEDIDETPGGMTPAPPDVPIDKVISSWPDARVNPDLYQQQGYLDSDIERMVSSRIAPFPFAGESALHAQVGHAREQLNFNQPLRSMEDMVATVLKNTLYLVKHVIKESVPIVGDEVLKPSDIKEPCHVTVKLQNKDPEEDRERIRSGLERVQAGVRSIETFLREDVKVDNPEGEIDQILAEQIIRTDPNLRTAIGLKAIEKLGMQEALEIIKQQGVSQPREADKGRAPEQPDVLSRIDTKAKEKMY